MKKTSTLKQVLQTILLAGCAALPLSSFSQNFPSKPIKLVLPTGPGTASDASARFLADGMSKALNTPVIVENKPGASGIIATEAVAKAPADGHTLLLTVSTHYINQWTMKPSFDAVNDFEPIARLNRSALVITTSASSPFKSVEDVISAAKKNPNKIFYATVGGVSQMAGALMANMSSTQINHALYKESSRLMIDTSSGVVDLAVSGMTAAIPFIDSGKIRALAVTTAKRSSRLPNTPALTEVLPGYELSSTVMMFAPKGTSPAIVSKLSSVVSSLASTDGFKELCKIQVCDVEIQGSSELKAAAPKELEMWGRMVQLSKTE